MTCSLQNGLAPGLLVAAIGFVVLLPILVLAFLSPFFGARLKALLEIA